MTKPCSLKNYYSITDSLMPVTFFRYDTTPEIVEYEAYFNVAERVVRIDRPDEPWQFKN